MEKKTMTIEEAKQYLNSIMNEEVEAIRNQGKNHWLFNMDEVETRNYVEWGDEIIKNESFVTIFIWGLFRNASACYYDAINIIIDNVVESNEWEKMFDAFKAEFETVIQRTIKEVLPEVMFETTYGGFSRMSLSRTPIGFNCDAYEFIERYLNDDCSAFVIDDEEYQFVSKNGGLTMDYKNAVVEKVRIDDDNDNYEYYNCYKLQRIN